MFRKLTKESKCQSMRLHIFRWMLLWSKVAGKLNESFCYVEAWKISRPYILYLSGKYIYIQKPHWINIPTKGLGCLNPDLVDLESFYNPSYT
jgi:hypothetical protein